MHSLGFVIVYIPSNIGIQTLIKCGHIGHMCPGSFDRKLFCRQFLLKFDHIFSIILKLTLAITFLWVKYFFKPYLLFLKCRQTYRLLVKHHSLTLNCLQVDE
jgi:hypothetical protein